jgi:tetratricopeptide (TPR) repeat protein
MRNQSQKKSVWDMAAAITRYFLAVVACVSLAQFLLLINISSPRAQRLAGETLGRAIISGVVAAIWFYRSRKRTSLAERQTQTVEPRETRTPEPLQAPTNLPPKHQLQREGGDPLAPDRHDPGGLADAMARECVKKGMALGRTLFLGHGTAVKASDVCVFEDSDQLKAAGFEPYRRKYPQQHEMVDQSELSKHCCAAGVGFALYLTMAACEFIEGKREQKLFIESLGKGVGAELGATGTGIAIDLVMHYFDLPIMKRLTKRPLLGFEKPGTGDILAVFLEELSERGGVGRVGFIRRGALGFAELADHMVTQTAVNMLQATKAIGHSVAKPNDSAEESGQQGEATRPNSIQVADQPLNRDGIVDTALAVHKEIGSYVYLRVCHQGVASRDELYAQIYALLSKLTHVTQDEAPLVVFLAIIHLLHNDLSRAGGEVGATIEVIDQFATALTSVLEHEGWRQEQVTAQMHSVVQKIHAVQAPALTKHLTLAVALDDYAASLLQKVPKVQRGKQHTQQRFDQRADELIAQHRCAEARTLLEVSIREMPVGWKPVRNDGNFLAIAFWNKREFLAYTQHCKADKSIKWVPGSYSRAWCQLAEIAIEEKHLDHALLCVDTGLKVEPDHPELWNEKGYILSCLKRPEEAFRCYQRAATVRDWAPQSQVARALRGQGAALIDLERLSEAEVAFLKSLELDPGSENAKKELEYIQQVRRQHDSQKQAAIPLFIDPPTDPLTVRLRAEVEDLEPIPGPRTVGSGNYSRILDSFIKRGWAGFEEVFDLVVPKTRADYTEVKRNLLRERVFSLKVQRNMLRLAKAFLSAKTPEAQQAAVQAELEKIEAERGCGAPAKSPSEDQSSQNAELPAGQTDRTPEPDADALAASNELSAAQTVHQYLGSFILDLYTQLEEGGMSSEELQTQSYAFLAEIRNITRGRADAIAFLALLHLLDKDFEQRMAIPEFHGALGTLAGNAGVALRCSGLPDTNAREQMRAIISRIESLELTMPLKDLVLAVALDGYVASYLERSESQEDQLNAPNEGSWLEPKISTAEQPTVFASLESAGEHFSARMARGEKIEWPQYFFLQEGSEEDGAVWRIVDAGGVLNFCRMGKSPERVQ